MIGTTLYGFLIAGATLGLLALLAFLLHKIKVEEKIIAPFAFLIPLLAALWFNGFKMRNVYLVRDVNGKPEIENVLTYGENFSMKLNDGQTVELTTNAYECIVVNESSVPVSAVQEVYSTSMFDSDAEMKKNDILIYPGNAEKVPKDEISYMPDEEFPNTISVKHKSKTDKWALRYPQPIEF